MLILCLNINKHKYAINKGKLSTSNQKEIYTVLSTILSLSPLRSEPLW